MPLAENAQTGTGEQKYCFVSRPALNCQSNGTSGYYFLTGIMVFGSSNNVFPFIRNYYSIFLPQIG